MLFHAQVFSLRYKQKQNKQANISDTTIVTTECFVGVGGEQPSV